MNGDSILSDGLADRIRRYAERHDPDAPGVIGRFDALDPSDRSAVRELLDGEDAEPITEADENTHHVPSENVSAEKSRNTNTPDGEGAGADAATDDESETPISRSTDGSESPESSPDVETPKPGENGREGGDTSTATPGLEAGEPAEEAPVERDPSDADKAIASRREFHPEAIVQRDWWVNWVLAYRYDDEERDGKPTKQPVAPYDNGRAEPVPWRFDLPDDEHPCTSIDRVQPWAGLKTGMDLNAPDRVVSDEVGTGIILPRGQGSGDEDTILLIDWDDVRDPDTEEIHPVVAKALEECDGYAEISQSGEGIHQFVYGEVPGSLRTFIRHIDTEPFVGDDLPAVEIYQSGRLCAMTGRHVKDSGEDVVEGQDMVDRLCWVFGTAGNASSGTPTDPFAAERDTADDDTAAAGGDGTYAKATSVPDHDTVGEAIDKNAEYAGPPLDDLKESCPEERSLLYHAAVHAFRGEYSEAAYWQLEGTAAVLGQRDGLSAEEIKADLIPADESPEWAGETRRQVDYVYSRAEDGNARAASAPETLADWGVIPDEGLEADSDDAEHRTDPREVEATVDPQRAWDAAGRVTPQDLPDDRLEATDDGEAFAAPSGDPVDVVRAVALETGLVDDVGAPLRDDYPEAYRRARDEFGAPLPEYYTTADAIAEFDAVLDVIGEVTFWDLDTAALDSEITETGDEVGGDAVRALNPVWRESDSEASVLVFDSGTVWDADTESTLDALRFVALDSGLIDASETSLEGDRFTEAYRRARETYGAPLPRWHPAGDGDRDITPQLPASEELLEAADLDGVDRSALETARRDVETLLGEAVDDTGSPTVVTALPATGKTTGTVKTARERPLSYLAPRKELQAQALEKADRWGVDAEICPVFAEERVRDDVLTAAVGHVREHGKSRLRDRWAILDAAFDGLDEDDAPDLGEIFVEEDDESVDLDRPTCETAEGEHGVAWALAVHVARRLGYTPQEIHTQARGLFGAPLPCSHGEGCRYANGWEALADPDDTADLLVGSYVHAHVESVRTAYDRAPDGDIMKRPRAVVVDEFIGEAFTREFGPEALDHATWLATCLRDDVVDRRDMYRAGLEADEWVEAWLAGTGDDVDAVADVIDALARTGLLFDAREAAREIRAEVDAGRLETVGIDEALATLTESATDPTEAYADLRAALDALPVDHPARGIARWVEDDVVDALAKATRSGASEPTVEGVTGAGRPFGGDLAAIVENAVNAVREDDDGAREAIAAATTALRGGAEGCRRLAAWADDGYAHPGAHHLLEGVITPTDGDSDADARRIHTDCWAFDPDAADGTTLDVVETADRARTVIDRNDHGALLHTPPSRQAGNGDEVALVGLDATGRRELWSNALGEDVTLADIHDTDAERAAFLREALDLRVLRAADRPRPYEGDPTTKDTDGDVALLEAIADEYAGIDAPRQQGEAPETVGTPAAITTKGVRSLLEDDSRLDDVVAEWENYGNVKGANDLGSHRLAAILGSQHYGDHAIERFCAIAGREVDTAREGGRGATLEYGDPLADAYLNHMREDQTMQAILRFARGDSGATVVARTSALREDLPVVGEGQVVETWSDTATAIAREYRRLGDEFTAADVRDVVDVGSRQIRRILAELVEAGYLRRSDPGVGRANTYEPVDTPGAGEVDLPTREEAVEPGRSASRQYYTGNVRVWGGDPPLERRDPGGSARMVRAPSAPAVATVVNGGDRRDEVGQHLTGGPSRATNES